MKDTFNSIKTLLLSIYISNQPPYNQSILIIEWWSSLPRAESKIVLGSVLMFIIDMLSRLHHVSVLSLP